MRVDHLTKRSRTRLAVVHDEATREEEQAVKERERVKVRLVDRADDEDVLLLGEAADCGQVSRECLSQYGLVRLGRLTEGDDLLARSGVESTSRFIEDEHARLGHDRARDRDAALLPARDAALQGRADLVVGDRGQAERVQGRVDVVRDVGIVRAEAGCVLTVSGKGSEGKKLCEGLTRGGRQR